MPRSLALVLLFLAAVPVSAGGGNRLAYLDTSDPYYPSRTFPKLITPQWVGEEGVEAVVVLAIDDMRGHERWEKYLRPILQRLKKIDGRAPVSIMTNRIEPGEPHLQKWLAEGLSLETHTFDHPCPLLAKGDFKAARTTYEKCIDLLAGVPGSKPVAFRMPCCDSLNTLSPRFFAELFNGITPAGNFLSVDSSVFNLLSADDPDLPRELVLEPDGRERFRKYVPPAGTFGNNIEDYGYPYVIGRLCWEFPCVTPSDWQAQSRYGPANPATLRDWKAALDATVLKKGVFCLVFHPYDWMRSEQVADLVDYAAATHGGKIKFLTFRDALARLEKNLLGGQSLRAADGGDNGVRLLDLDGDGYVDVVIGNDAVRKTRLWQPGAGRWVESDFPVKMVTGAKEKRRDTGVRFGVVRPDGKASLLVRNEKAEGWHFDGRRWVEAPELLQGLEAVETSRVGQDQGVRLADLDGDGVCELIVGNARGSAVFSWSAGKGRWEKLPFALPAGVSFVDASGKDAGLRLLDIDEDGRPDVVFAGEERSVLALFTSLEKGWSREALRAKVGEAGALPPFVRKGTNNGAWVHSRRLWWQNENTSALKDLVDRRSFGELLASVDPTAKSPEVSLRCLKPRPGFVADLMVAEPLVRSPIAFAWGADGRLWVVEMGDYPLGADGKGKPGGRIKVLESSRGDGKYDKATLFLDGLSFPTGVLPWGKGVLITCAPDILYAEDTTGKGKADRKEVLYTGFVPGNPQHRVNTLAWGLDNWIHCANGDSGGRIRSLKTGKEINISGRDFRIRPEDGGLEAETGQTQYGRSRDDWGNWFGGNNSNPVWHFVLPDRYLRRNPHVAPPELRVTVPVVGGAAPVFPQSRTLPRFNDPGAANRFTSACSPIIYRDELFGPAFAGNSFVSEPVHNLVHREIVTPEGVTFRSRRAPDEEMSEFLASADNWCRPTTIAVGPDGALWMADMYRAVIEHPQWIPLDWQKRLDLRAGEDRGRIYRIFPVNAKPRAIPRLDRLDTAGLVAALDSPSGWQRDTVQRLLLSKADRAAVPLLEKLAAGSKRPLARLHALCTLDGMDALTPEVLTRALADSHAGVRRHAVRLCEGRFGKSEELAKALLGRLDDTDAQVRLQVAFTLGEWDDERAGRALGTLAARAGGDRYLTAAVLSSVRRENLTVVLRSALEGGAGTGGLVTELLGMAGALKDDGALLTLMQALVRKEAKEAWQLDGLVRLLDGLERQGSSLEKLQREGNAEVKAAVAGLAPVVARARALVKDEKAAPADRVRAVAVLGRTAEGEKADRELLAEVLNPRSPEEVQSAAVAALARKGREETFALLLAGWRGHVPAVRSAVLEVLLARPAGVSAVLEALEKGTIPTAEVAAAYRQRLLTHADAKVRARAAKVLAGAVNRDRQKVVETYRAALKLAGDPGRGKTVFGRTCATCHKLAGSGGEAGPDLTALGGRPGDYLLEAIFDPNRAVEARYISYIAETKDGRILTGIPVSETSTSLTMVGPDGKRFVLLRADLESLTSTGRSLMPEGLESDLKPQDVADLLAVLRGSRKPKSFPGNKVEEVKADSEGVLHLRATSAEIYGPTLVFEETYRNLGYWSSADDEAAWTVAVPRAGRYVVSMEYACAPEAAGNVLVFEGGREPVRVKVETTKSWDSYRRVRLGVVELEAGERRMVVRPDGEVKGALIDLKEVRLVPEK
jgi:putative membrane-bound dehydrogenase-like protein